MTSVPAERRPTSSSLGLVLEDHVPVILITILYIGAGWFAAAFGGWPIQPHPWIALGSVVVLVLGLLFLLFAAASLVLLVTAAARWILLQSGRTASIAGWSELRRLVTPSHVASFLLVFSLYVLFIDMFVAFKRAIPEIQPFIWDVEFMRLDRALHFGRHPWEILQPLLGRPRVTDAIDAVYYLWFPVNFLCLAGFLWSSDRALRMRFYLSFWIVWIVVGTVFAFLLSSAGPCYFDLVTGRQGPYGDLMAYLHRVHADRPLIAITVQAQLWADYTVGTTNLLMKGISAMPSVHVALPVLYTIAGWRIHRGLGTAFGVYAVIIFLGSIHLGWHYAIDGYVSALIVPLIWWGSGPAIRAYLRRVR